MALQFDELGDQIRVAGDPEGVARNLEVSAKTLMARYERSSAIVRP